MRRISTFAALLLASMAFAQESHISAASPSWKGLEIWFVTKIEPPGTQIPGGVVVEAGQVHRLITDRTHKKAFGYDVTVEPGEDGKSAQLRIQPFFPGSSKISFEPDCTFVGLPQYPVISSVGVGETVALDLLANGTTGQKIVDYLTLRRHAEIDMQRTPRDFSLTDVELTILDPRILVNGSPEPTNDMLGLTGAVMWLYVPGHGRFILSLVPHDKFGFVRNGIVSGNGMLFHDGTVEIRVECRSQVVPGSGAYNLYAVHQPAWRPPSPTYPFMGAADAPEYVINK